MRFPGKVGSSGLHSVSIAFNCIPIQSGWMSAGMAVSASVWVGDFFKNFSFHAFPAT